MKAKCVKNEINNTNFTVNKEYEMFEGGIRTDCAGMWVHFGDWNRPKSFKKESVFKFAQCEFEIL